MNNSLNSDDIPLHQVALEHRVKKAIFRSEHRGSKEMDLIMGQFAKRHLPSLTDTELQHYETMLDEEDSTLWNWVIGKHQPNPEYQSLVEMLKQYAP
jgi:antitoxin CptB